MNLISGIFHILNVSASRRGYFDALRQLDPGQIEMTAMLSALSVIAVCVGAVVGLPPRSGPITRRVGSLSRTDRVALPTAVGLLLPASLLAFFRVREHVSTLEVWGDRIIELSGGMARYAFMSNWLVWAISFAVIWFAFRQRNHEGQFLTVLALSVGVLAIFAALQWTGGRSIAIVLALPLIMVVLPQLRLNKFMLAASAVTVSILFILRTVAITEDRFARSRLGGSSSLAEFADWQWGRFSLLGFAVQHVDYHGYLFGETFLNAVSRFAYGPLHLVGLSTPDNPFRSSMDIAGQTLLNSNQVNYIVPGMSSELYINFGIFGIVIGYFILGRLCGWVDRRLDASFTPVTQLFWAYVGSLLVFRTVASDSGGFLVYLFYVGAPLVVVAATSHMSSRRQRRSLGGNSFPDGEFIRRVGTA